MSHDLNRIFLRLGKELIHLWTVVQTQRSFKKRFQEFFDSHPELKYPINKKIEKKHITLWKRFGRRINLDTLRLSCNLSKSCDYRIVPEEIFATEIQPILLKKQNKNQYLGSKSFYNRWFKNNIFPEVYIHNIDGVFLNKNYDEINKIQLDDIISRLNYPVVVKPNIESFGGKNIFFPKSVKELSKTIEGNKNFVIQELIVQHPYFAKYYNKKGINSVRINLYRSVKDNKMKYLNSSLRLGRGKGLDNLTAGGLICSILKNGKLNSYAVDKNGNKYLFHPDSKIKFSDDNSIPKFNEMIKIALQIGNDFYYVRLMSLDLCLDKNENWRVIEVNLFDIAIRAAQLGGIPFFGEYTNEIIEYCLSKNYIQFE